MSPAPETTNLLPNVITRIINRARQTIAFDGGLIGVVDAAGQRIIFPALPAAAPVPLGEGILGRAAALGAPQLTGDVTRSGPYPDPTAHAVAAVPMFLGDNVLGVFAISSAQPDGLATTEMQHLLVAAGQAAETLALAMRPSAPTDAHRQPPSAETESLQRIAVITSATLDMDEMLTHAIRESVRLLDVEGAMLLIPDQGYRLLAVHQPSLIGITFAGDAPTWPLDGHGHIVHAYHTGRPFINNTAIDDPIIEGDAFQLDVRNVLTYPLNTRSRTLGVLSLFNSRRDRFAESDMELVHAIASQVAVSLESAQLFAAERSRADLMALISRISQEISFALELQDLLDKTAQSIHDLIGYEAVYILLLDENGEHVSLAATATENPALKISGDLRFSVERGAVGHVIRTGTTQNIADTRSSPHYFAPKGTHRAASSLTIPLRSGEDILGAIDIASTRRNAFTATDEVAMQTLAAQVATGIKNVRLYRQAQRQARDQGFLRRATAAFSRVIILEDLLLHTAEMAAVALHVDYATAAMLEKGRFRQRASSPPGKTQRAPLLDHLPGQIEDYPHTLAALHAGKSLVVHAQRPDSPAARELTANLPQGQTTSHLLTPIMQRRAFVGVIELAMAAPDYRFAPQDIELIESLARQAGIAAENVTLIEELERRAKELTEANRLKSEFLASISHELRTPMNAIIGFTETLLSGIYGSLGEKPTNRLQRILRNARSLLALIDDLLDISKIEAGQLELHIEPVSLADEIHAALSSFEDLAAEKSVTLSADLPPDLPLVEADPLRLRQIINNLLSNAVKFTDAGTITIHAGETPNADPPQMWCSVADSGIGIAPEHHALIFDEFRQVDGTTTRRYSGTGLGLAITKKLVLMMGGDIAVKSAVGEGSIFTFWLPLAQPPD